MIIANHDKEFRILERRKELLLLLDSILKRDIGRNISTDPEDAEIAHILSQYEDVQHPSDVCDAIKDIHPDEHYSPPK